MPVIVTFDIVSGTPQEHNRIQSAFERLGWESLGGSSYRYPRLGTDDQPVEDWLNHIVPALMLFRSFIVTSGRELRRFTLDVQSSSGYNSKTSFGSLPNDGSDIQLYSPSNAAFGETNLRDWITSVRWPY